MTAPVRIVMLGSHVQSFRCLQHVLNGVPGARVVAVVPNSSPTAARNDQDVAKVAHEHDIPVLRYEQLIDGAGGVDFDLGMSILYDRILPAAVLDRPARGFVNIHLAPLPMFRGVNGVHHAIRLARTEGLHEFGITMHYMDTGIDTGAVIARRPVRMFADDTAQSLHARATDAVYELFVDELDSLLAAPGRVAAEAQSGAARVFRRAETVHEIDLAANPDDVYDQIRALSFPGRPRPYAWIGRHKVFLTLDET